MSAYTHEKYPDYPLSIDNWKLDLKNMNYGPRSPADRVRSARSRAAWLAIGAVAVAGFLTGVVAAHAEGGTPAACASPKIAETIVPPCQIEEDHGAAWRRCFAKTGRFNGTAATDQQRMYLVFNCGFQAGVWAHRDP